VIQRPDGMGGFEFVVLATLRSTQLIRGCLPRIDGGHKSTITAQMEVATGKVTRLLTPPAVPVLASDLLAVTQES
jgi:hypothetical protein